MVLALLVASALAAWGPAAERRDGVRAADAPTTKSPADRAASRRLREGTELADQVGHFEPAGQRLQFMTERGDIRLVCLENLNLERIARTVTGSPGRVDWLVTGTVTEYRGVSFLLVERAVVKTVARARGEAFQPLDRTSAANDGG